MPQKLIIDLDAGIGDAVAAVVALLDPELDVLALTATAGCVSGETATKNLQAIVEQLDPPKRPRIGAASADLGRGAPRGSDAFDRIVALNGPTGLGDCRFDVAELHNRRESSKMLIDLVRANPHEIKLLTLGPLFNVSAACEREPDFLNLLEGLYCLGGTLIEGGDVTATAEFNVYLDPEAAKSVLGSTEAKWLIPLDVSGRVVLPFETYNRIAHTPTRGAQLLAQFLPYAFRSHHQYLGVEGVLLREITALGAISRPQYFRTQSGAVDVELTGELTRGMTVFDRRPLSAAAPNVTVVTEVDAPGMLEYIHQVLNLA